jgi:hypothetical protein
MIILSTSVRILLRAPLDRPHYLALPHQDPIHCIEHISKQGISVTLFILPLRRTVLPHRTMFPSLCGTVLPSAYGVHQAFLCRLQAYAAYCLHTPAQYWAGPLSGRRTHNPEVGNLGPYHYASGGGSHVGKNQESLGRSHNLIQRFARPRSGNPPVLWRGEAVAAPSNRPTWSGM